MERRTALALAFVMFMPALAGCNIRDWYNQEGYVSLDLFMDEGANSTLDQFRSIKAAVYGATIRQLGTADAKHFTYGESPRIIDLVEMGAKDERIRVTDFKTNIRATDQVTFRVAVFEAIDAAGNNMEICRLNDSDVKFPCFYQPENAALVYNEKSFSPPRGGSIVVGFPLTVHFASQGKAQEYFLFADPGRVTLTLER